MKRFVVLAPLAATLAFTAAASGTPGNQIAHNQTPVGAWPAAFPDPALVDLNGNGWVCTRAIAQGKAPDVLNVRDDTAAPHL